MFFMDEIKEKISHSLKNAIEISEILSVTKDACSKNNYFEIETCLNIIIQKQNQLIEGLSFLC